MTVKFFQSRPLTSRTERGAEATAVAETTPCLNCGQPISGRYCAQCGQDVGSSRIAFGDLLREGWREIVQVDSKLVKTLGPLLFKPGFLTREYLNGRRVRYLSPFKMYLVVAALFFTLISWRSDPTLQEFGNGFKEGQTIGGPRDAQKASADAQKASAKTASRAVFKIDLGSDRKSKGTAKQDAGSSKESLISFGSDEINLDSLPSTKEEYERQQKALPPEKRNGLVTHRIAERVIHLKQLEATDSRALERGLLNGMMRYAPNTMFFLLPVFALLLKLLYLRTRRLYIEHLIFALHIHTLFFIVCGLDIILDIPQVVTAVGYRPLLKVLAVTSWLGFALYGFVALRSVYGQGIFKTLIKSNLLVTTYLMVIGLAIGVVVLIALATL
ncbi:MAG: DUF3667 domain-containing protein [Cytophagales bacterium]|nr:DUF3667 domain-containing protein [Armatimonadota bacterium]